MITYTHPAAGNLPIKTLVVKQQPTNSYNVVMYMCVVCRHQWLAKSSPVLISMCVCACVCVCVIFHDSVCALLRVYLDGFKGYCEAGKDDIMT